MKFKNIFSKSKDKVEEPKKPLEQETERIVKQMNMVDPLSDDYQVLMDRLHDLEKMTNGSKTIEKKKLDPNVMLTCAVSLVEVGVIVYNEYGKVITSKALGFIKRV